MIRKLDPEELCVTSFDTVGADTLVMEYTPDCCTDDFSGCQTGPEVTCDTREHNCATVTVDTVDEARVDAR